MACFSNWCFLENRFPRVVLTGQTSLWESVLAGVPHGSVLGPLFFLIYINDMSKNLSSNTKLFADDTSTFCTVKNVNLSTDQLNSNLEKISNWTHHWKMSFNPDPKKQAQEVIFLEKEWKTSVFLSYISFFQWHYSGAFNKSEAFRYSLRWKTRFQCSYKRED